MCSTCGSASTSEYVLIGAHDGFKNFAQRRLVTGAGAGVGKAGVGQQVFAAHGGANALPQRLVARGHAEVAPLASERLVRRVARMRGPELDGVLAAAEELRRLQGGDAQRCAQHRHVDVRALPAGLGCAQRRRDDEGAVQAR
ncbi:hypothetical protein G6F50_015148 [Rhizopus delemar]|uniref:Uncharacterized protein n=1 Tax=Rhizopus delemar TaxID=936053 RepID=A0A9P6Y0B1_9FUNG|nr:hypothetical protein G6F50_015148 [Rhizopus delemar]